MRFLAITSPPFQALKKKPKNQVAEYVIACFLYGLQRQNASGFGQRAVFGHRKRSQNPQSNLYSKASEAGFCRWQNIGLRCCPLLANRKQEILDSASLRYVMSEITRLADTLIANFRRYFTDSNRQKAVIGISGGVDSAVVAAIAARAIGSESVFALRLPHQDFSSAENLADARAVCDQLALPSEEIEISRFCAEFFALPFAAGRMTRGNIMARVRMILLYAAANEQNGLVLGTGNKTELLTGFFTKYGDGGVDVEVIGEVWKTEVFALSQHFGLPKNLTEKPPSAELFRGHTDEKELGIDYPTLDYILQQMEGSSYFHVNNPSEKLVAKLVENARHKSGEVPAIARKPG